MGSWSSKQKEETENRIKLLRLDFFEFYDAFPEYLKQRSNYCIFKATSKRDNQVYEVTFYEKQSLGQFLGSIENEIKVLEQLSLPTIRDIYEVYQQSENEDMYIVKESVNGISLFKKLKK